MARIKFTAPRLIAFTCPPTAAQSFLWGTTAPGLGLRVTANDSRASVFQSKLGGKTLRMTIGSPDAWSIPKAEAEARRLQTLIDQGKDPRAAKVATTAACQADRAEQKANRARSDITGLDAWEDYCADRRARWGDRNHADHVAQASAGGKPRQRGDGVTKPGPLHSLLRLPLAQIDDKAVEAWAMRETKDRPTSTRLGFGLLRAFLNWCATQDDYRAIAQPTATKPKSVREKLGKASAKDDALQRDQLASWFTEVRKANNPAVAAYLQTMLLTGPRPEELRGLRWVDLDFKWNSLAIRDKVEGTRTIPLTPNVSQLLDNLPRRNRWVFSSPSALTKDERIADMRDPHVKALTDAGLPHVSLHGLRRSFGSLAEWVEVPVGIVAQIQGHNPSAIAGKHYRVRPLDLLRAWHQKIEAWVLEQARIRFDATKIAKGPRLIGASAG